LFFGLARERLRAAARRGRFFAAVRASESADPGGPVTPLPNAARADFDQAEARSRHHRL
jgi:hypothetical protein